MEISKGKRRHVCRLPAAVQRNIQHDIFFLKKVTQMTLATRVTCSAYYCYLLMTLSTLVCNFARLWCLRCVVWSVFSRIYFSNKRPHPILKLPRETFLLIWHPPTSENVNRGNQRPSPFVIKTYRYYYILWQSG